MTTAKQNDVLLGHIMNIKEDTAGIKEHLKTLNGKVVTNVNMIECNRNEITKVRLTMAKWAGSIGALFLIVELIFKFI